MSRFRRRTINNLVTRVSAAPTTYSTSFPSAENPISEGGIWINGDTSGAPFGAVQTSVGKAYADHLIGTAYTDSIAFIDPAYIDFGPNHYVEVTIYRDVAYTPPSSHEIQVHLRASGKGTALRPLYEVLLPWSGTFGQIFRQDGNIGGFTDLGATGSGYTAPSTGDVFRVEISGDVINVYYKPSGGSFGGVVMTATDSSGSKLTTGQPGMGFYVVAGTGVDPTKFCISNWTAGSL